MYSYATGAMTGRWMRVGARCGSRRAGAGNPGGRLANGVRRDVGRRFWMGRGVGEWEAGAGARQTGSWPAYAATVKYARRDA
ncbi:hypothetical protein EJ06DRAFT_369955 [Trichodelitschia bisporula]|uniref:Uncharacterized protein n=1 Tax=Trichodelitschia bisporula TaxID=703511 RepID=A0A6G1I1B7_9PEZI|nr:hypothetical protein EJ06DRAFT_369955 [Trichodelitschia bisporula]